VKKFTISGSDIKNSGYRLNPFNNNVTWSAEYNYVQEYLENNNKDWGDIIEYKYIIGLALPAHMELHMETGNTIDGYEVEIILK
jgi:hypothetical protein